jgi:hypothetical protein
MPQAASLRQGRFREEGSEGSQRQICKLTDRNTIEGRDSWDELAQHNKVLGSGNTVNGAVVQRQFSFLSGEICSRGSLLTYGSLIEVLPETAR